MYIYRSYMYIYRSYRVTRLGKLCFTFSDRTNIEVPPPWFDIYTRHLSLVWHLYQALVLGLTFIPGTCPWFDIYTRHLSLVWHLYQALVLGLTFVPSTCPWVDICTKPFLSPGYESSEMQSDFFSLDKSS